MGDEYEYEEYDWGDYGDYGPFEREYSYVEVLVWLIFPTAALGFVASIVTLVFVALFPKPLKTTIIHCIVLCVASILTCMISLSQAFTWEYKLVLKEKGDDDAITDFILVDYSVSWITILLLGVANWLFVAFVAIRLYAISKVNINSYNNYVTASSNEVDADERPNCGKTCGIVTVILCFGWLLPTFILPLFGMIEYYCNWLTEDQQVGDVLAFAFKHDFNHRTGSVIYVLCPIGLTVLIAGANVVQTALKSRGLKFMRSKWDKAKFTLGAIVLFLISRIPQLCYVFFAFQAYPAAPKPTGDEELDKKLASEHDTFVVIGNRDFINAYMGPTGPICLLFACGAAVLNLPLFFYSFRRFRSLCSEARVNCSQCHCCKELTQRSTNESELSSTDAEVRETDIGSYIAASVTPETNTSFVASPPSTSQFGANNNNNNNHQHIPHYQSSPKDHPQSGNFFFNSAHLNGHDSGLAQSSFQYHSRPIKGDFV